LADLVKDKDVPGEKDMQEGKAEAALTSVSLAAAKGLKKVNALMNAVADKLKSAIKEMAAVKATVVAALNSTSSNSSSRSRELE